MSTRPTPPSRTDRAPRVLIVYGTTEGQTHDVARRLAEVVRAAGAEAELVNSADALASLSGPRDSEPWDSAPWDGVIVGASVHQGHHQTTVREFVLANASGLKRLHSAFVSLSLSAATPDPVRQDEAVGYIEAFLADTGWQPDATLSLGGALRGSEYGPYERLVLDVLGYQLEHGVVGPRDASYTDWGLVEAFAQRFVASLRRPKAGPTEDAVPHLWW